MRVIVANSFQYRRGGDAIQALHLTESLERNRHVVAAFGMQHPANLVSDWNTYWPSYVEYRGELSAMKRLCLGSRSIWSHDTGRLMRLLIEDFSPDVVHFHAVHHHLTMAVVNACLNVGVPTIWTLHDYRTVCPSTNMLCKGKVCERCIGGRFWHGAAGKCKSGEVSRSLAAVLESYITRFRGTLGKVDCYVAPSRFLADMVLRMGLPARRLEVVPNPVVFPCNPPPSVPRKGLLYVGRLAPEKGVACLLRAVADLPGLSLTLVGDGPEREQLELLASRLEVDADFEGWSDSATVAQRMMEAELLCVPSEWYENCPGVVLEAMALKLPVVASSLGGLVELLDGGAAGWLASPGDVVGWRRTISAALENTTSTRRRTEAAIELVVGRHDPDTFLRRIEAIYSSVASKT